MTGQIEEFLGIVENIAKIKKLLNELRELPNTKPIDRGRCIQILSELYAPFTFLVSLLITYKKLSRPGDRLKESNYAPWTDSFTDAIDMIMEVCRQNESFNDDTIIYIVSVFYGAVTSLVSSIEQIFQIPSGLKHLVTLIEKYKFDSNWIVAVAYLTVMEIAVNRKLRELGINVGSGDFKIRVDALLKELENRGLQLGELEKLLPPVFWRLRNEVVHGGYTPSDEELQIIIIAVSNLLEKIGGLRSP